MDLSAVIRPGDDDLYFAEVTIGHVKVTVHEHEGNVRIKVDAPDPRLLSVNVNDWETFPGIGKLDQVPCGQVPHGHKGAEKTKD